MSPGVLYLDTARLGRMAPGARRVVRDFVGLAGEVGLPLYGEEFLRSGFSVLPRPLQSRFSALSAWTGVAGLKSAFRDVVETLHHPGIFLAHRSALLMRLAIQMLTGRCRRVLTTDFDWSAYGNLLDIARRESQTEICGVPLRNSILREKAAVGEIVSRVASAFVGQECDGLFLTAVTHDGIRFPVVELVREIERQRPVRMLVVDGAQAFCQIPTAPIIELADFFIAGCHKWLSAFEPLGIAFTNPRVFGPSTRRLPELLRHHGIDDPLLNFTQQLEGNTLDAYTETVNVAPLFACAGALKEALRGAISIDHSFRQRLLNANRVAETASEAGWKAVQPAIEFQSGILLLEPTSESVVQLSPLQLRTHFHNRRISLTAYENGCIRLSMPDRPFKANDLDLLPNAFLSAATAGETALPVR
ncbi:MAG: hypothetical protein JSS02_29150 [Planctomycetes bacterium]|nr:hypothetical protein [Planctomycetota bacterium]